jgi:hypothetical protein
MKKKILFGIILCGVLSALSLPAQNALDDTKNVLEQWVETRQIISEEQNDWQLEKAILKDTESLLSNELTRLNQALDDLAASATAADEDRTALAAEKEELTEALNVVESSIGGLEAQMKQIVATLPAPLVDRIKPLVRRLPKDPNSTKVPLGERVQNIVGILSQADKFNTTITQTAESREISEGKVVEVRTLYWGLAMAYFVDSSAEYAGIGYPAEDGWEWPEIEGSGSEIKKLLDVYEGTGEIQFVEVPARIN